MKKVVIIGGTKGIGLSTAKHLAQTHCVSVVGRTKPEVDDLIQFIPCDLLDTHSIQEMVQCILETVGIVNYLLFFQRFRGIHNAWEGEIQVSLTATKLIIESLANAFDPKEASIVITGSANGSLINGQLSVGYHVVKAGLMQMARYYATVLGSKQIRVNSLALGTILKEETGKFLLQNTQLMKFHNEQAPLRRLGTVLDVAHLVEFLCSPKSAFMTGHDFVLNGGVSIQWQESLAMEKVR